MQKQTPTTEAVASEVRAEMGRQRKKQADLADVLGIYTATAARRLDGSVPFDVVELATVARWLGTRPSELMARAERALDKIAVSARAPASGPEPACAS